MKLKNNRPKMNLIINSTKDKKEIKNIESVSFETPNGQVSILQNHSEAFFIVKAGKLKFIKNNQMQELDILDGVCYVQDNIVKILL